jgi:preprotein translocase subunit YajC
VYFSLLSSLVLAAAEAPGAAPAAPEAPTGGFWQSPLPLMGAIMILFFYLMVIQPQRKQQKRRLQLLAAVKKNDRVLTASGIYGVVTNVDRAADEVTIKVDEATNTKLRVTLSSIAQVVAGEASEETASK